MSETIDATPGPRVTLARDRLTAPRAAAVAGILFAVLYGQVMADLPLGPSLWPRR